MAKQKANNAISREDQLLAAVRNLRTCVESFGPPISYRKLNGILNALEMQVEDGRYQRHAVVRLCEACLATSELYSLPDGAAEQFERLVLHIVNLVEGRR